MPTGTAEAYRRIVALWPVVRLIAMMDTMSEANGTTTVIQSVGPTLLVRAPQGNDTPYV